MARYQILSYRRNAARDRLVFTDEVFAVVDDRDEESLVREEHNRILRFCYRKLSKVNQELVKLRYQDGLSLRQAADELNKQVGAVKVQIHRIRLNLKKCVHEQLKEQQV